MAQSTPPLTLHIELTPEQQQLIRRQIGLDLRAVPFWSGARSVRCQVGAVSVLVDRGVFVPTAGAERMLSVVTDAASAHPEPVMVDVGTGSGALALAFAAARPQALVFGTDVSELALRCARRNRARLRLRNVRFLSGSLLELLPARLRGRVSVIAANLPYLPPGQAEGADNLFPERTALGMGADGLELVRRLARSARQFLSPAGALVLQLAPFQWPVFERELSALGYGAQLAAGGTGDGPVVIHADWQG